jgi:hypothetical protein
LLLPGDGVQESPLSGAVGEGKVGSNRTVTHLLQAGADGRDTMAVLYKKCFKTLNKKIFAAIVSGVPSVRATIPASAPLPADMEKLLTCLTSSSAVFRSDPRKKQITPISFRRNR